MPYLTTSELERLAHNQGDSTRATLLARIDDLEVRIGKALKCLALIDRRECPDEVMSIVESAEEALNG